MEHGHGHGGDDEGSSLNHLLSGAVAGVAEHCIMFPIDTIKTHLQVSRLFGVGGAVATTKDIIEKRGFKGLFKGVSAAATGSAPAHAMYFSVYELCKKHFATNESGGHNTVNSFGIAVSGATATITSDGILTPMDAVKQRMQLQKVHYRNLLHAVSDILKREGFSALYAGYTTTLVMNVPYSACYFLSYETLSLFLRGNNKEKGFNALHHCLAGGGAGAFAACLTNPLDVVKTRLQTQGDLHSHPSGCGHSHGSVGVLTAGPPGDVVAVKKYQGMLGSIGVIFKEEGWGGFSRGVGPRMVFHSMSAAICWTVYEFCKSVVKQYEDW